MVYVEWIKYKDRVENRCIHEAKEPKIAFVIKSTGISTNPESRSKPAQILEKVVKERKCIDKRRSNALVWYNSKVVALHNSVDRAKEQVYTWKESKNRISPSCCPCD